MESLKALQWIAIGVSLLLLGSWLIFHGDKQSTEGAKKRTISPERIRGSRIFDGKETPLQVF